MSTAQPNPIRQARQSKGLSQDELADLVQVSKPTISGYENDRFAPSPSKMLKLVGALKPGLRLEPLVQHLALAEEQRALA